MNTRLMKPELFERNWLQIEGAEISERVIHMLFTAPEMHLKQTEDVLIRQDFGPALDVSGNRVDPWHPMASCWTFQGAVAGAIMRICEQDLTTAGLIRMDRKKAEAKVLEETIGFMASLDIPKSLCDLPRDRPDPDPEIDTDDFSRLFERYSWVAWWADRRSHTTPADIRMVLEMRVEAEEHMMEHVFRNGT